MITPAVRKFLGLGCRRPVTHRRRPSGLAAAGKNGKIECVFNRLVPAIQVMLYMMNLPPHFWLLAAQHYGRVSRIVSNKKLPVAELERLLRTMVVFGSLPCFKAVELQSQRHLLAVDPVHIGGGSGVGEKGTRKVALSVKKQSPEPPFSPETMCSWWAPHFPCLSAKNCGTVKDWVHESVAQTFFPSEPPPSAPPRCCHPAPARPE